MYDSSEVKNYVEVRNYLNFYESNYWKLSDFAKNNNEVIIGVGTDSQIITGKTIYLNSVDAWPGENHQ
jgi:hypothetical protein